jgi:DNA repair ATPase RecN
MKTIKTDFGTKIKMLLDKTENDDKLIAMLKQEIARLENVKGVKSALKTVAPVVKDNTTEMVKLKRDVTNLTNQVKCYEIEIEQKNEKIN